MQVQFLDLFFDKDVKDIHQKKRQNLHEMVLGKLDFNMQKKDTRLLYLTLNKLNSGWIKDLNIRLDTTKQLVEKAGSTSAYNTGRDFPNETIVA